MGIKEIWQKDASTLTIVWADNKEHNFDALVLRQQCPCASCVDEYTGMRKPVDIDPSTLPTKVFSVGRYAVGFHFSDGHTTGIYSYDYLRSIGK